MLYLARLAGRLAQLEERLVYTQEVGSSRLSPPTSPEPLSRHSLLASGAGDTGSPSHPTAERIELMASRRRDVRQVGEQVVGMSLLSNSPILVAAKKTNWFETKARNRPSP